MKGSMSRVRVAGLVGTVLLAGCVSLETHNDTVAKLDKARKVLSQAGDEIKTLQEDKARLTKEAEELKRRVAEVDSAAAKLQKDIETAERERAARDAQLQELSQARADLAKSLEAEIAKEEVTIRQVRDQVAVTVFDQLLFTSGQTSVRPEGLKVLKQLAETLKTVSDKQIRVEGHTDSKGIGAKLRDKYPTNWELSTARAASVLRYLVEEGGLDRETLTAVGHADTRPVASNDTPEGRKANRRIEIVLYPKLSAPAPRPIPTAPSSNSK